MHARVEMSDPSLGHNQVARHLSELSQKGATGELIITAGDREWQVYLYGGRLLYATGSCHKVRRWYRYLKVHCGEKKLDASGISSDLWEYHILRQAVSQEQLSVAKAESVMLDSALEVMFALSSQTSVNSRWKPSKLNPSQIEAAKPVLSMDVEQVLKKTQKLWSEWQEMGLSYICPDLAPVLRQHTELPDRVRAENTYTLTEFFDGQSPIWDIALEMRQSLTTLSRSLHHFLKQGIIELRELPDLPSPVEHANISSFSTKKLTPKPLIACIDDSPLVGYALERILTPAGYRVLKIQDPMQAVATLAEHRPALILLDVVMPHTTGYSLCSFLRQTSLFGTTPIIMLTGRDCMMDRTRSKLAGATDFLKKPTEPEKMLKMIEKYLTSITEKKEDKQSKAIS